MPVEADLPTTVFMGSLLLLMALILFLQTRRFLKSAVKTTGMVSDYVSDTVASSHGFTTVVRFTVSGRVYRCYSRLSSRRSFPVGSHVEVFYNPKDPTHAYVNKFFEIYFFELVVLGVGVGILWVSWAKWGW